MSRSDTIRDLDCVVLLCDVAGWDGDTGSRVFRGGAIGTVVHEYDDGTAFEVEFVRDDGQTLGFVTAERDSLRLATKADIEGRPTAAA